MLQAAPKLEDFPALGGLAAAAATGGPSTSQAASAQPSTSAAADGAAAGTGVSDALKAANKASSFLPQSALLPFSHHVLLASTHTPQLLLLLPSILGCPLIRGRAVIACSEVPLLLLSGLPLSAKRA